MASERAPMDDDAPDPILTLDNVPLDLPVAAAGTRALAAAIDYLVVWVLMAATAVGAVVMAGALQSSSPWWIAAVLLAIFGVEYGYFSLSEIGMDGRTLGKQAVGLRVVARDGSRPSNAALLVRNAVRTIDMLVGVPLMIADAHSRRLGDRLAGTIVIRTRTRRSAVLHRIPAGFGPRQIALLEEFLVRCDEIEAPTADRLAESLLAAIARSDPAFVAPALGPLPPVARLKASLADGGR